MVSSATKTSTTCGAERERADKVSTDHERLLAAYKQLQIKAILYQLVRRYRWSTPAGYIMPEQQAPIAKPRDGLPITLHRL